MTPEMSGVFEFGPLSATEFMKALTDPAARNLSRLMPRKVPSGLPVDDGSGRRARE